jgi:hypothetical protein
MQPMLYHHSTTSGAASGSSPASIRSTSRGTSTPPWYTPGSSAEGIPARLSRSMHLPSMRRPLPRVLSHRDYRQIRTIPTFQAPPSISTAPGPPASHAAPLPELGCSGGQFRTLKPTFTAHNQRFSRFLGSPKPRNHDNRAFRTPHMTDTPSELVFL